MHEYWLSTNELAKLLECSQDTARRILRFAAQGKKWQGCRLVIRTTDSNGGRGNSYYVQLNSLPPEYYEKFLQLGFDSQLKAFEKPATPDESRLRENDNALLKSIQPKVKSKSEWFKEKQSDTEMEVRETTMPLPVELPLPETVLYQDLATEGLINQFEQQFETLVNSNCYETPPAASVPLAPVVPLVLVVSQPPPTVVSPVTPATQPPVNEEEEFETLLFKKIIDKNPAQKAGLRQYYRKLYRATGQIPPGLRLTEGRQAAGRKSSNLNQLVETRLVEMLEQSVVPDSAGFVTKNLRKITTFHKLLEEEFKQTVSLRRLYQMVKRLKLDCYLYQEDNGDQEVAKVNYCFNKHEVFDLIQMDGCQCDYLEIQDLNGQWRKPQVIEFFDTASRVLLVMDVYFSETSENSIDLFCQFLTRTRFPKKTIRLRPDNAGAFLNLKRPIHELNQKYAAPDGFLLMDDFARVRKPKDKTHLERSHRTFHQFEFFVIREFNDRIVERVPGVKFKTDGSRENITVTRLKATLSDLMMSGIIEKYRQQHNQSVHQFSEQGERSKWAPEQRLTDYLDSVDTLSFGETEVEIFYKYGAPKSPATVSKSGTITYKNQQFNVVSGEFSRHSSTKVKISAYEGKLFIFEDKDDGVCLGEAVPVKAPENSEEIVTSRVKRKVKQNEFEMIRIFLENQGLVINQEKLLIMYQQGLTLEISMLLINQHQSEYEKYNERGKGFLSFNLFASHVSEYLSQGQKFKPYAQVKVG